MNASCLTMRKEMDRSMNALPKRTPYAAQCPTRLVLDCIADKWAVLILGLLQERSWRFNALLRQIEGLSQKVLSQTLKHLERDGLLSRDRAGHRRIRTDAFGRQSGSIAYGDARLVGSQHRCGVGRPAGLRCAKGAAAGRSKHVCLREDFCFCYGSDRPLCDRRAGWIARRPAPSEPVVAPYMDFARARKRV